MNTAGLPVQIPKPAGEAKPLAVSAGLTLRVAERKRERMERPFKDKV